MITLTGEWNKVQALLGSRSIAEGTMKRAKTLGMRRTLAYFERQIKLNIRSGGNLAGKPFLPNSPLTIKIKGSSKPLINHGDLIGNVSPVFVDENFGFVGLKRGSVNKGGDEIADIAEINEFGAIVKNHEVPKRPFIGPVLDKFTDEAGTKYLEGMEISFNE